jgi:hypothetical protein
MRACDSCLMRSLNYPWVVGGRRTGQKHSKPTRPKLQDPASTFQLAGASCFSDMHYVTALKLARRSDTRRDGVMSHSADANATFVTFWFGHQ